MVTDVCAVVKQKIPWLLAEERELGSSILLGVRY